MFRLKERGAAPASAGSGPNPVGLSKQYSSKDNTDSDDCKPDDAARRLVLSLVRLIVVETASIDAALAGGLISPGDALEWLTDVAALLAADGDQEVIVCPTCGAAPCISPTCAVRGRFLRFGVGQASQIKGLDRAQA